MNNIRWISRRLEEGHAMYSNQPYASPGTGEQYRYPQDGGTQIMGPAVPQAAPYGTPPPSSPPQPPQSLSGLRTLAILAIVLGIAGILFTSYKTSDAGSSARFSHLQSQVTSLTQQVRTLTAQRNGLSQQVTTLAKNQGQLSSLVSSMSGTVKNLAPFSHGVCPGVFQGSKGAFNAPVPCNPGG